MPDYIDITEDDRILYNSHKIAEILCVNEATLRKWSSAGCPKEKRGWWDLAAIIKWRGRAVGVQGQVSGEAARLVADTKLKEAQATIQEMKLHQMTGDLVPVKMVEERTIALFQKLQQSFLSIGDKLMNEVYTLYPELAIDAKRMIDNEVREALRAISKNGIYKPDLESKMAGRPRRKT